MLVMQAKVKSGFTILELVVVAGIVLVLTSVLFPLLRSFPDHMSRESAVSTLLQTFERARVDALRLQTRTYVGFAGNHFGKEAFRQRGFITFRDALPEDETNNTFIALSKWQLLPRGIYFKEDKKSLLGSYAIHPDSSIPYGEGVLYAVVFNSAGIIENPIETSHLRLLLLEDKDFPAEFSKTHVKGKVFTTLVLNRFTGRAHVERATEEEALEVLATNL